jgi:hypothetical protein
MNKTAIVVGVIVAAGIAAGAASLWRGGSSDRARDAAHPVPNRTQVSEARNAEPAVATAAPVSSTPDAVDTADDVERITGHPMRASVPAQLSKSPDPPEANPDAEDGKSMAPALVAVRSHLEKLLRDAGPDGAAVVAALPGARAVIERSLNDPDPAVRGEASALLKTLSPQPQ